MIFYCGAVSEPWTRQAMSLQGRMKIQKQRTLRKPTGGCATGEKKPNSPELLAPGCWVEGFV
jgi:hypothetical protein